MVAVNYLWNPINDNIVREFDDAGNTIAEYTTEPDLYGNVVSQYRNGQTSYLLSDGQGNTTELTNDAGTVTDTIRYSAFGQVTQRTGTTEVPFQYVGQKGYCKDEVTRQYLVRRRSLSQDGRWTSRDPISKVALHHAYVYATNNPIVRIDPAGLQDFYCRVIYDRLWWLICQAQLLESCAECAACTVLGFPFFPPPGTVPWAVCFWACTECTELKTGCLAYTRFLCFHRSIRKVTCKRIRGPEQGFMQEGQVAGLMRCQTGGTQLMWFAQYECPDGTIAYKCAKDPDPAAFPEEWKDYQLPVFQQINCSRGLEMREWPITGCPELAAPINWELVLTDEELLRRLREKEQLDRTCM